MPQQSVPWAERTRSETGAIPFPGLADAIVLPALVAAYFVAGKLGLQLAFVNASATAVWAPTGIALAAFLTLGYRVWPAIFLGAFLVNATTAGSVGTSICIGAGNTLEGVVGAYLVNRFAGGRNPFARARDVFKFAALAAVGSTMVSATCGVTTLLLAGLATPANCGSIWLTWWLGDAAGDLVVAPFAILWAAKPLTRWSPARFLEAAVLLLGLTLVAEMVFAGLFPWGVTDYPLEFLCMPFLVWAAFRFGAREVATAVILLSGIAITGTLRGLGPFSGGTQNEALLLLQAFMAVAAVMTLSLAAVVGEREAARDQLQLLAVTDLLTGLGNYRQLISVLDFEITRSQRTDKPFSMVFLDVDDLKKINDALGHLAGNRALVRVAEAVRASCRATDAPARFGGDEFALVLPETGEPAAHQVAKRICNQLQADAEAPPVSVSVGVALYPRDGATPEMLLGAADRGLYQAKAARRQTPGN
jgi:diguanylate cyclase (GGDEF)-like protein